VVINPFNAADATNKNNTVDKNKTEGGGYV
jgi:hypothetical protein